MDRRSFLTAVSAGGLAFGADSKPALLGGTPVRTAPFPSWPVIDETEERALLGVLRGKKWFRGDGKTVNRFEEAYAKLTGARHCLATANGTSALLTSLAALGVGAGDEVIVPPYTFIATVNAVLALNAFPVFVDTDPETFQIDATKIEAAITERTKAIMPVHLGGAVADLDAILAIGKKHKLPVVEDACQAHLAEWRGRKAGTYGATGCFSFQASKNLNSGEGGAILTNDEELVERCFAYHNNSSGRASGAYDFSTRAAGLNLRMTEFQAGLLMAQMARVEAQSKRRSENAQYLTKMLGEISGIAPARMYDGCTRNAYHLYMFRYAPERFAGLPRAKFLKALEAEGVPASPGYSPLNKKPFLANTFRTRAYQATFPKERLERTQDCPANDRLCEEAVWFTQNMLLGPRRDMDEIAAAVRKIQAHAEELCSGAHS
ncbi:MAG: DegT/DnrJ/EryC1/StrS family aminotransferase [Acidobacteriota bacterium]